MSGLWHVDADAMMVRRQEKANPEDKKDLTTGHFTDGEAFTNTVNQFVGGNLITFTEDFAKIDQDRKMLYRHVVPSVNASSRPLDPFNLVCPEMMLTEISPKCRDLGHWNMLSVINWSDAAKDYSINLDQEVTGNLAGSNFLVYDFQSMQIIARLPRGGTLKTGSIGAHQSKVLKIVPWDGAEVMFLATDLSFSCGGIEISDLRNNDGVISGTLDTGWFVPVRLSFVVPTLKGYEIRQIVTVPGQKQFIFSY
jgi:hypothetical protein